MGDGPIAFVCAMPMELEPLVRKLSLAETDGRRRHRAHAERSAAARWSAIVTGMGTELATAATERAARRGRRSSGSSSSASPARSRTRRRSARSSCPRSSSTARPDASTARRRSATEHRREDVDDRRAHHRPRRARRRCAQQGVVSLDMETAAIAERASTRGIPWSVFRAISDRATDGSVDDEVFHLSNQDGTPNAEAIAAVLREASRSGCHAPADGRGRHARHRTGGGGRHRGRRGALTRLWEFVQRSTTRVRLRDNRGSDNLAMRGRRIAWGSRRAGVLVAVPTASRRRVGRPPHPTRGGSRAASAEPAIARRESDSHASGPRRCLAAVVPAPRGDRGRRRPRFAAVLRGALPGPGARPSSPGSAARAPRPPSTRARAGRPRSSDSRASRDPDLD